MSKKIVIVGPAGAGKTTLRKVFFEGENAQKLLEYALKPTYGEDSMILRLKDNDLGIFDLAGQENQRWLETEDKSIFYGSNVILIVFDVTTRIEEIEDFIRKIVKIRDSITPNTNIFVLIHKIDLIDQNRLSEIKLKLKAFNQTNWLQVFYTSIKKEFLIDTFSFFIEVIKTCLQEENIINKLYFNLFQDLMRVIQLIDEELVISKNDIQLKLNLSKKNVDKILEPLIKKLHIQQTFKNGDAILSITNKGKENFKEFLRNFSLETFFEFEKIYFDVEPPIELKIPAFIGAYIADKDGKLLLKIELFEGALEKFLTNSHGSDDDPETVNLELIPMFISALEKFSYEINIQNMARFNLKGKNLEMQIFGFDTNTVTIFMNPDINMKTVESVIFNYFQNLFNEYSDEFEESSQTGSTDNLFHIGSLIKNWLKNLNELYEKMVINLEVMDFDQALILYGKIDELFRDINLKFSVTIEKIKKLKLNLMKSILEKDIEELKKIVKIAQEIRLKYN